MRALSFVLLSAIAVTAIPAAASTRGAIAQVTKVYDTCPVYEGYPDCHPSGRPGWTIYSTSRS
jgi:hypothetical protein